VRTAHRRVRKCSFVESGTGAPTREQAIAARLADALEEPLEGHVRRLSSGASRETFAFQTRARGELVVQIARGGGSKIVPPPPQARLLSAAAEAGVPVPRVVAHGEDDEVLGRSWAVVEALEGTTDPKAILAGEGVPGADELIDEIASALAAVHRMPRGSRAHRRSKTRSRCCARGTTASASPTPRSSSLSGRSSRTGRMRRAARSCTATSAWAT